MSATKELETIFAISTKIKVGEKEIEIRQVKLEDLPLVMKVFSYFAGSPKVPLQKKITDLIISDMPSVLLLITKLTSLDETDASNLNLAATVSILAAVLKENADFLSQQVLPVIEDLNKTMVGLGRSKA